MSKSMLDSIANALALASVIAAKEQNNRKSTVRRTRTARQVLDKKGNVVTLYTDTETITARR